MFRLSAKPSVGAPSLLQTSRTEPKPRKLLYAIAEFGPLHHRLHSRDFRLRQAADIEPGSPLENGYCESFNARFRDELLNGELFYTLKEAQILIEQWRVLYNTVRPNSALGYRPPAPESIVQMGQMPTMH